MGEALSKRLEACNLGILVPQNTSSDLRTLLGPDSPVNGSEQNVVGILDSLEHRTVLYFG